MNAETGSGPKPAEEEFHHSDAVKEVKLGELPPLEESLHDTVRTILVGKPLNLEDKSIYHHISLVAFLAWVGLGADGLSSSTYGPAEAFHHLGNEYRSLALILSVATIFTVLVISACYSYIIEAFPSGGGGYLVASKLLGRPVGVISGCALVVDYILTVTVSIAAAGDVLFEQFGSQYPGLKIPAETFAIVGLILLNLRGVKESVTFLLPIFILFLVTHAILIVGGVSLNVGNLSTVGSDLVENLKAGASNPTLGVMGVIGLLLSAYAHGAGTYTGIEAVSNSMPVMREPRVATAQRTMIYMAVSLALTAGGLMLAYLLFDLSVPAGPANAAAMNANLTQKFVAALLPANSWLGGAFVMTTSFAAGSLLIVAAQAGFIDGPRVLANMAHDSFVPHKFGSLSDRLATHNGILLIGLSALVALWFTGGVVTTLVTMYSINVFLTFSLSMLGMLLYWNQQRLSKNPLAIRRLALFGFGATMCLAILCVTVYYKFMEGGYITVLVTGAFAVVCFLINWYYKQVSKRLKGLDEALASVITTGEPNESVPDPDLPTAVVLVGGFSGLGVHTVLNALRYVPKHFKNVVFVSAGIVDSGNFKGAEAMEDLRHSTENSLDRYVKLARNMGFASNGYMSIGTDVVAELETLCRAAYRDYPRSIIFAGQLVFQRETWVGMLLHNQTAYSLQRRLQWDGIPMMILPTRVRDT